MTSSYYWRCFDLKNHSFRLSIPPVLNHKMLVTYPMMLRLSICIFYQTQQQRQSSDVVAVEVQTKLRLPTSTDPTMSKRFVYFWIERLDHCFQHWNHCYLHRCTFIPGGFCPELCWTVTTITQGRLTTSQNGNWLSSFCPHSFGIGTHRILEDFAGFQFCGFCTWCVCVVWYVVCCSVCDTAVCFGFIRSS